MSPDARRVEVQLGTLCNNRCSFCVSGVARDLKEPWAPLERVRAELRHFYERGCRAAGFLGGEPTVYPHIVESVAYAKSLGYESVAICTNGTRLSDRGFCEALVDAGLTRATVSIHSHRAEVEDGVMTRVPGNFARKLAGLDNLLALRAKGRLPDNVSLNPVLCRPNLGELEPFVAFFGERGLDDIRFNFIWPSSEARGKRDWIPTLSEAVPAVARAMLLNERRWRKHLTFGGIPRCALRFARLSDAMRDYLFAKYLDEAGFDPDNDVSLATKPDGFGDRFVWQERKRDVLKTRAPQCERCAHASRCDGVWGTYAELYGLDELQPLGEKRLAESHRGREGEDLLLRTTFACNQRCAFCFVPLTGRPAERELIERELDALAARMGPRAELTISGGEPAADPRLPELLESARRRGFKRFVLQTNAVALAREGVVERLAGLGVASYLVSLHSRLPARYDAITGSRGQLERALRGLSRLLAREDCDVTVNVVVNARNVRELPALVGFVARLRPRACRLGFYFSMLNEAGHQKAPDWAVDLAEAAPALRQAVERCEREGLSVSLFGGDSAFPVCLLDEPERYASPGLVPQQRVVYRDGPGLEGAAIGRVKKTSCKGCRHDARCAGVPASYAALFGLEALTARP